MSEVEDEGARPLITTDTIGFAALLEVEHDRNKRIDMIWAFKEAIREEATAALQVELDIAQTNQDTLARILDADGQLDRLIVDRDEWRTRAEAAEGALARFQQLYTLPEVSKLLKVSVLTLRTWQLNGRLKFIRLPGGTIRVREDELERIIAGRAPTPTDGGDQP